MIASLKNRPILNLILLVVYYVFVVTTHQKIGRLIATHLDKPLGRQSYNLLVLGLGLIALALYLIPFVKGIMKRSTEERLLPVCLLLANLALIVLCFNVILVINVEIIHFVQYCILALLLFPILKNFTQTLFWGTVLGALDEAYQYWILFPGKSDYYDFNDVIIDFLGVALGLILLKAFGEVNTRQFSAWWKQPAFIGFCTLVLTGIGLYVFGILSVYPSESSEPAIMQLIKKEHPEFWKCVPPKPKTCFHIVSPWEFMIFMIPSFFLFNLLSAKGKKAN